MRALAAAALWFAAGCSLSAPRAEAPPCTTDLMCGTGRVCFPDGCGDPGQNIVVEVTGNGTGLHAQDFAFSGAARATMNLDVRGPLILAGRLLQNAPGSSGEQDYSGGVAITAHGKSELIPGLSRTYQLVLPRAEQAAYQMFIGSGTYTVTARATDPGIPYERETVRSSPGRLMGAKFTFRAFDETLVLTGQLVRTSQPTPKYQSGLNLQAFEAVGGLALSQATPVQNDGTFQLHIHPDAAALSAIVLVATPRDNTELVPTKTFVISPLPRTQSTLGVLELGEFGDQLVGVEGRLSSASGGPIANATVSLEGRVTGEGTFRARAVLTDAEGKFRVDLLPSAASAFYTLTATPPAESSSGIVQAQVKAGLDPSGRPWLYTLDGNQKPQRKYDFTCPDRMPLVGTVLRPDGTAAVGVKVEATAVESVALRPMPTGTALAVTDGSGTYRLVLDPAKYRFDYVPNELLPRKSRIVRVEPEVTTDGRLPDFYLSVGRTVNGQVTVRPNTEDPADGGMLGVAPGTPTPNALVRFYRVTSVEGVDSSLLIGEGYTDERGYYSIALPSASQ